MVLALWPDLVSIRQNRIELFFQVNQIIPNDIPENFVIYTKIAVDQAVSEAYDTVLLNKRICFPKRNRKLVRSFSDNFKIALHGLHSF